MVGEGRRSYLTHIFLWIIIPLILFPIIWIVSTSIRRDQAAFSTRLFSSRLTLQNYIDLLTPEKNMPVLIQELQNLISRTPPYNEWDLPKIEKLINEDIDSIDKYLKETQDRYRNSKESFNKINIYLIQKKGEIKDKNIKNLENLLNFINKKLPKEGSYFKEEKNINESNLIKREYTFIQDKILNIYITFNKEISSELDKILKDIKGNINLVSFSDYPKNIKNLVDKLDKYPDLHYVSNKLRNILKLMDQKKDKRIFHDTEKLCLKISYLIEELEKNISILKEKENKLALLNQKNEFLEMQEILGGQEQKEELEEHKTKYDELKTLIKDIDEKINIINTSDNLETIISEFSAIEERLTEFISDYIFNYGRDEIVSKIEEVAGKLRWFQEYNTLLEKYNIFSKNIEDIFEKSRIYLSEFISNWRSLLETSIKGEFVTSSSLDNFYNLIKMDYVNLVAPNLNVVSKKAGDLMDLIPYKEMNVNLDRIDGELFRIDQIWKQKTKHYFLNWVRNSILVAGFAAIITTIVCSIAAYPFSRMRFWGRRYGIMTLLLIQMFPSAVYMIAIYSLLNLLGRFVPFLGLDTLTGLTFVYLGGIAYNMYIIKGFYDTIPDSLEESAMIDGATRFQTFYKIVIPLARPILAVVIILTFMNVFNEFIFASIILQDAKKYTYAIGLWTFSTGPYLTEWGLFTAAALLGMLPMTILFLSLQKYIVSGLTKGAVKG